VQWFSATPYDVYVGSRGFAVCRGVEKLHARWVADLRESLQALATWLSEDEAKRKLRIWLSGGLCRPFLVSSVPGISGEEEWRRIATAMAPMQCGLEPPCRVWLSPPEKKGHARVAVALEEAVLTRLLEVVQAAARKHRIASIRPWWSEVLRLALQREPAAPVLAVRDCDALTVLVGSGQQFDSAATLSPVFDAETAEAALARMLMTADVAAEQGLQAQLSLTMDHIEPGKAAAPLAALTEWSR
jgi:hypothetical protein